MEKYDEFILEKTRVKMMKEERKKKNEKEKNKQGDRIVNILIIIVFIIGMFMLFWGLHLMVKQTQINQEYFNVRIELMKGCFKIESCERYSCLSAISLDFQTKHLNLLKEQNCLLMGEKNG